jgi:uncharacterized protein
MRPIYSVTLFILILGGLNWGAIALTDTDVIAHLFGGGEVITRFMYGLAGLAALVQIGPWLQQMAGDEGRDPTRIEQP